MMQDFFYACRLIWRTPILSGIAIAALALGIGATTALFSVVQAVLLRPLPYMEPDRLVQVVARSAREPERDVSPFREVLTGAEADALVRLTDVFAGVTVLELWTTDWSPRFAMSGAGDAERVRGAHVDVAYFDVLGVGAAIGRTFTDVATDSDGVVISHGLWQRQFSGDPGVLGRTILLNGEPRVIIGVLPRAVRVTYPLDTDAYTLRPAGSLFSHVIAYQVVARLADDVSAAGATASLSRITESGADAVRPNLAARPLQESVTRWKATGIWLVAMAAAILCLAACANAAMLLLTRTVRRLRDVGVRLALGASHWRILRQALLESLVVGVCGTTLGVLLAGVLHPLIVWLAPPEIPRIDEIALDGGVLAFAVAVGLTCSLVVGLVSWRVMRSAHGVLTAGQLGQTATTGRRTLAWRRTLLATQTAMLVVLLSAAGLLLHSFWNVWRIDLGFRPEGVTVVSMMTAVADPRAERSEPSRRMAATLAELRRVLTDTPGVTSVALGQGAPFARLCSASWVPQSRTHDVSQQPRVSSDVCNVSDGYLELLGVDVLRGRSFNSDDVLDNRRVAIVSTSLVERYFEGESALGRLVHWGEEYEVVGVVGDVRWAAPEDAPRPAFYLPWAGQDSMVAHVVVRSSLPTAAVAAIARETVRRIDPLQPIDRVVSMDEIVADATVERRFHALATGGFGVLALLLGAVGIFGGVAASVAERLREVGIRMALGATAARVRWFAMRHSLLPVAGGLLVGALCAVWTTRLLERFLFGVSPVDVPTLGVITAVIVAVALVAAWVPARRAVRTNPADVLRQE